MGLNSSDMLRDRVPAQVPHFSLERLDDETLLYHPGLTKAVHLNETAALVWALCDGGRTVHEIATLIGDAFPDHADDIRQDVEATVERLVNEGALSFAASP